VLADAEYPCMNARDGGTSWPDPGHLETKEADSLLQAAARGDQDAFELAVTQLSGPIYHLVRTLVRDRAQAEEVTQEVLFEMWRQVTRYDPARGSAAAWALTIARRRTIDRVRSMAASSARERRNAVAAVSWDQVSEALDQTLDREELHHCLDALSSLQLQAIVLAFYGGHTYPEIATLLGVPLGTVKARIRDAVSRLRDCMQAGQ
jgi:RNA polymerase sigma-70 factor (ECF subfamily)